MKDEKYICPNCGEEFILNGKKKYIRHLKEKYISFNVDPFCSEKCRISYFNKYRYEKGAEYKVNKLMDKYYEEELYNNDIQFYKDKINKYGSIELY